MRSVLGVEVRQSLIAHAGQGLFAVRAFEANERIDVRHANLLTGHPGSYICPYAPRGVFHEKNERPTADMCYVMNLNPKLNDVGEWVDGQPLFAGFGRFANCPSKKKDANAVFRSFAVSAANRERPEHIYATGGHRFAGYLFATRRILPNQEILAEYGDEFRDLILNRAAD